jgi:hypothetical protein
VDFNFSRLLFSPSFSPSTESAYPLMLYGTFWYQHVPECNFIGASHRPFTFLAIATYVFALVPTAVFAAGFGLLLRRAPGLLRRFRLDNQNDCQGLTKYAVAGLLIANLGIMLAALVKYHVWSIMQGRLLFPSMFGILVVFSTGVELTERTKWGDWLLKISMAALCILFLAYLFGEIGIQVIFRFMPGVKEYLKTVAA